MKINKGFLKVFSVQVVIMVFSANVNQNEGANPQFQEVGILLEHSNFIYKNKSDLSSPPKFQHLTIGINEGFLCLFHEH